MRKNPNLYFDSFAPALITTRSAENEQSKIILTELKNEVAINNKKNKSRFYKSVQPFL